MNTCCAESVVTVQDLKYLFSPSTVAHVGASPKTAMGRFNFTAFLQKMNFTGRLYPVNPKYEELLGVKCYPSINAIPEDIDMAIMALPSSQCVEILKNITPGKIKFVVVHTSGFGEIGKHHLEGELQQIAIAKGFRIIGPNCMGIFSQKGGLAFWQDQYELADRPGSIGIISQSGGLAIDMVAGGIDLGIGIDKAVSLGNQIDITVNELLEFMGNDEDIKLIGIYVEDIKDGRRFLELLQSITPRKPVLVWKGGLTEAGKAAVMSHTSSMAGNAKIFLHAMRQAGAIVIDNYQQMLNALKILQPPFALPGRRMAFLCPGGGNTVNINDAFCDQPDLTLPVLSRECRDKLEAIMPAENVDSKNPIDMGGVGYAMVDQILRIIGSEPEIDSIILTISGEFFKEFEDDDVRRSIMEMVAMLLIQSAAEIKKPIFLQVTQARDNNEALFHYRNIVINTLIAKKIPWIDGSFHDSASLFSRIAGYCRFLEEIKAA